MLWPKRTRRMKLPVKYSRISPKQRREVREEYIRRQDGKCFFCKEPLDQAPAMKICEAKINWDLFPGGRNFLRYPIHLQHDHITGLTEGAVHAKCNAYWWEYHGR